MWHYVHIVKTQFVADIDTLEHSSICMIIGKKVYELICLLIFIV